MTPKRFGIYMKAYDNRVKRQYALLLDNAWFTASLQRADRIPRREKFLRDILATKPKLSKKDKAEALIDGLKRLSAGKPKMSSAEWIRQHRGGAE